MKRRKKKSALMETTKDIARFGGSSMMVGGLSAATGKMGHGAATGMTGVGSMMPTLGTVVVMKGQMKMLGEAMPLFKGKKKRKKY